MSLNKQLQVRESDNRPSDSILKQAPPALEDGSAVELGKPPDVQYGVIRWIRSIGGDKQAYVELVNQICAVRICRIYLRIFFISLQNIKKGMAACLDTSKCLI